MKKRMIFPLVLLCAPAVLQAMEVANSWQLPQETANQMYAEFMKPSWPAKKDPYAGLSEDRLAEEAIKALMLRANGCGAGDAKFDQRLEALIKKLPGDKLAALTSHVVTDAQQERGENWQAIKKATFETYPANMAQNIADIAKLDAELKAAQAAATSKKSALDAAQKAFDAKKKKDGYYPRTALATAEQKSIAAAEKPVAKGVVARLRAQADKIEAFEETFKHAVALRAITAPTTTVEIDALTQQAADARKTIAALQAQLDEKHDANDLITMLKHAKVAQLEKMLAGLKMQRDSKAKLAQQNDNSIADITNKEKRTTKDTQRMNQLRADNGRISEEMQKLDAEIKELDAVLHPQVTAASTGLLGFGYFGL